MEEIKLPVLGTLEFDYRQKSNVNFFLDFSDYQDFLEKTD